MAKRAFEDEGVACRSVQMPGLADIDSRQACEIYERELEKTIDEIRRQYPEQQIDLALSDNRNSIAALTMLVAQRKGIRRLYDTLISDAELNLRVEKETTVSNLTRVNKRERNNHL